MHDQDKLQLQQSNHIKIVVTEGKVTMEDLHAALEQAVRIRVPGGCNCGLTGFDITFLRGDPELNALTKIPNIQAGLISRE